MIHKNISFRLKWLVFLFVLMGSFLGSVAAQPLSLDETIDALIVLFEAGDYRVVVTQYSHPDAIAGQEAGGVGREEAINKLVTLQEQFGGLTLKRLKEAKGMQPQYLNDGQDALFDFKGGYFLRFRKDIYGKWRLL